MNNQVFLRLLKIAGICAGSFIALFFLLDYVFNGIFDRAYYFMISLHDEFGLGLKSFIAVTCVLAIFFLVFLTGFILSELSAKTAEKKAREDTFRQVEQLLNSFDAAMQKDNELIVFPPEYRDIENRLNHIKYTSLRNEQLAKDAEQRKNDLVVYLAHDLKTPLTSVIGYLSLLNEEQDISPDLQKKYLSISLDKSQRLEDLINEFFDITRFNLQHIVLDQSPVNFSMILQQLADEFYPVLTSKNLRCELQIPENMTILADADKMARVFDNLLKNAIAYSNPNTVISIRAVAEKEQLRISFRNSGRQIPEHKLNSIFEKFYRLDSARSSQTGGAGLGLAIAKEIVELHHGTITVISNPQFTEFTVSLPVQ